MTGQDWNFQATLNLVHVVSHRPWLSVKCRLIAGIDDAHSPAWNKGHLMFWLLVRKVQIK